MVSTASDNTALQDSFYKRHTQEEIDLANASLFDFDHPDALDMDLFAQVLLFLALVLAMVLNSMILQCLTDLKTCKQSNIPVYSFAEHQRLGQTQYLYGAAIIIGRSFSHLSSQMCS